MARAGKSAELHSLNINYIRNFNNAADNTDQLILLFPVFSFDAPQIIYNWCKKLPEGNNKPTAIISVSAGGELPVNNACRTGIMRILGKKGYLVSYEAMLQMPSNMLVETPEKLALNLIRELPEKIESIVNDILSGKEKHRKPELSGSILAFLSIFEKISIWQFGKSLKTNSNCSKCGLCINNCPKNNIAGDNNKIKFKYGCEGCFKCIYACPNNAIYSKIFSFLVLKNGYSIKVFEDKLKQEQ